MNCPHCESPNYKKNGFYFNKRERIQKFKCKDCLKDYSVQTTEDTKYDHRPEVNDALGELLAQGKSQNQIAKELKITRPAVAKKIKKYELEVSLVKKEPKKED